MFSGDQYRHRGHGPIQPATGAWELARAEAMELLANAAYGRVAFTLDALPAIRPVNHLVDDGRVIVRTRLTSAVATAVRAAEEVVVCYQADSFDSPTRAGWSVAITGRARTLTDADQVRRYEQLLQPWVNRADTVMAIDADIVTGFRISAP